VSDTNGQWLTHAELAERFGCSPNPARMHAMRRGWPRRSPNRIGDTARVLVPEGADVRESASHVAEQFNARANGRAPAHSTDGHYAVAQAIAALAAQLEREQARADRAETLFHDERAQLHAARRRIDELQATLADALGAERIAAGEAEQLRGQLDRLKGKSLLRRLRWALRPHCRPP
jgi:hypothetical protein